MSICDHVCVIIDLTVRIGVLNEGTTYMPRGKIKLPVVLHEYFHSKVAGTGLHYGNGLRVTTRINKEDVLVHVLGLPERGKGLS